MNHTPMKWHRLAPGLYELRIGYTDALDRYEIKRVDPIEDKGYSKATVWYLTYPRQTHPDAVTGTLRDAKAFAEADYVARLEN